MSLAISRSKTGAMSRSVVNATAGMGKLFVRTALSHFIEARALENCHHVARLEDRWLGHGQSTRTV
jgi:hypothetical protein